MRKSLIIASTILMLSLTVLPALALTPDELGLGYGTYTGLGSGDVREGIMTIIRFLLGFLGIIAVLIVLYGGFVWMTAGGNEEKVGTAKKIITAGIIGLVIIFIAYAIASFVIGQLITATGATY
ncbi:MAG: hypothetical protein A3J62_00640 [Candidatus Buchananbacteria bacterium RIFCSPHIGHO2_02_FULL_38_8]|uniref:Uncharacterized protein n=2 Tax=Candidatus Buchananiibacteriota TaxID=1817903 RepID=A0A1G1XZZ9_9BACT|nr:MAG: hypothetical protein A2731_03665 [Candidatus Buchananbacteria bacterium RIFCSPHIGHO2_01_FULL_39_8]OGY47961.1 MAG: hypothetical protein A3J62_00640 [Candidatus Buchananbacteria bacterium RIFCSPHIGHO2_02_FULL_38_8]